MDILVNVANQKLKIATNFKSLIAGTQKFIRFVFNVTGEWDGLTMFAQFEQNGVAYREYLDSDNSVFLPPSIKAGTCTVMLYGSYDADNVIGTTNYVTLTIDENNLASDFASTEISPSLYNQLIEELKQEIMNLPSATTTTAGLMSPADKTKLNGIATGANKTTVTNNLTSTSTTAALSANQGRVLNAKLDSTIDKLDGVYGEVIVSCYCNQIQNNPSVTIQNNPSGISNGTYYKISDEVFTYQEVLDGHWIYRGEGQEWTYCPYLKSPEDYDGVIYFRGYSSSDWLIISEINWNGITFPSIGVYTNIVTTSDGYQEGISCTTTRYPVIAGKLGNTTIVDGVEFDGTTAITHYGVASAPTSSGDPLRTVECEGFKLVTGARILVKFVGDNIAYNVTLNVNNTGAIDTRYKGAAIPAENIAPNKVYEFVYDGTYYNLVGDFDTKREVHNYLTSTSTTAALSANQGRVLKELVDGKASTDVATTDADGLMSAADKVKLDSIDAVTGSFVIDSELSDSSTNPVQNRVITSALNNYATKSEISHYGTCSTDATNAYKSVECPGFTLDIGARITVKFIATASTASMMGTTQLDVDSTGSKEIRYNGRPITLAKYFSGDRVYEFIYDGTYYQLVGDLDTDTHVTVTDNLTSTSTTAALSANQGRVLKECIDTSTFKMFGYTENYNTILDADKMTTPGVYACFGQSRFNYPDTLNHSGAVAPIMIVAETGISGEYNTEAIALGWQNAKTLVQTCFNPTAGSGDSIIFTRYKIPRESGDYLDWQWSNWETRL